MLTRNRQVASKIQALSGTEESLSDTDFRSNVKDLNYVYDVTAIDRGLVRGTLTPQEQLAGKRLMEIHMAQELVGGAASSNAPWHTELKCGGFQESVLKVASYTDLNGGTMRPGDLVGNNASLGSATKTARVVDVSVAGKIVFKPLSGTFVNTDKMYNYATPQVDLTVSSTLTNAGYAFRPLTENESSAPPIATTELSQGGERHTLIDGRCRNTLSFTLDQPPLLRSEYRGIPVFDPSNPGRPRTGSSHTITQVGGVPSASKGIPLRLDSGNTPYAPPVLTKIDIDFGTTISDRPTITDQDLEDSGHVGGKISARAIKASIDPDYVVGATFDTIAKNVNGDTFEFFASHGSTSGANGKVAMWAPKAQLTGQIQPGDRDGVVIKDLTLSLAGNQDDEFEIWHIFVAA